MKKITSILFVTILFSCQVNTKQEMKDAILIVDSNRLDISEIVEDSIDSDSLIYNNDSTFIFETLMTVKKDDYGFRSDDGIVRSYRKIKGKWSLATIQKWEDSVLVWSQKPYDMCAEPFFELDWLYFNKGLGNYDFVIPFENGKTWQVFSIEDSVLAGKMITYFRSGQIKEIVDFENERFIEYNPNGSVRLKYNGSQIVGRNFCKECSMELFDSKGKKLYSANAKTISIMNIRTSFRIVKGELKDWINDTIIKVDDRLRIEID